MGVSANPQGYATGGNYMQVGGAVTSVIGAYSAAQGAKAQAGIDETNARVSELGAQAALLQGQREEQVSRMNSAQLKGAQRVSFAANGVDLGSDSAVRTLTSTDYLGEVDANTAKANAVRAAFGYRTQAVNSRNSALARQAISPGAAGASTLLGTGAQVARHWYSSPGQPGWDLSRTTRGSGD